VDDPSDDKHGKLPSTTDSGNESSRFREARESRHAILKIKVMTRRFHALIAAPLAQPRG